ncbi:molecular chaperone Hsp33 [Polymorphobacter multimanifer]|uniref:Molecular chaperone Hsp33 n=1 Tax=Polymorphobacter multimanifer TaxID=1070431 RepID=A0A841L3D6_9SPHN|nr:Hsp33 family molecular chaperone HslO [Polymorphobacter multimanifer]MBB6225941.1 molecular chaperone Hsp33 [Polymorphobacter multimanifer]
MVLEGLAPAHDANLGFSVPARDVRGRLVRLDTSLTAILAAHAYPPPLAATLAEALVTTALVGATLRDTIGGLTLQAQAKGPLDLLVCDWNAGALRGYLKGDPATPAGPLEAMFGEGHLAVTLDQTDTNERYQGIVPLEGSGIAAAIEQYFRASEQIPTLIRTGLIGTPETGYSAGGILLQYLPRGEDGQSRRFAEDDGAPEPEDWQHMRTLASSITEAELADPELTPEALLWRLFHEEEVRLFPGAAPSRGCRCSPAHIAEVLGRFPEAERADMRGEDGMIGVDCQFCSKVWRIDA